MAEGRGMACGRGYEDVGGGWEATLGGLEVLSEVAVAAPGEGCWLGAWEGKGRAVVKEAAGLIAPGTCCALLSAKTSRTTAVARLDVC